ncbi:Hsp20/alpha crystallin family protein [Pelagicoccus sp. SDUM812003]|uniref:Hsp20/alpha crystallin family protein n=1 Tax=Pelagicoccus sp. SDUM812003 TaxID=3041267 RepID=UPI0028106CED|nr:Hsp20/alpha crystallin family protein [Pelagicoccus sp. SDUM812003]MDQ8202616.1 Hsp20/alpha crystallin family protein [Pelagicoccus sp. SDUM812003]
MMNQEITRAQDSQREESKPQYRKPRYTVLNEENAYRLDVQLPGVAKDAARITLDGNLLTVEADAPSIGEEGWQAFRREIPQGGFKLSLELNVDIDGDAISAKASEGVLTVMLPLAAKAAKRTIAID